jgi:AcrR family transcriptional regulator
MNITKNVIHISHECGLQVPSLTASVKAPPRLPARETARGRAAAPDRRGTDTPARLGRAAALEFNAHGYAGTDSNKIARRAGFAPQTFYRWFAGKTEIFLAVYAQWEVQEWEALGTLQSQGASTGRMVDAVLRHHWSHLRFRRSLRQLALEDPSVRRARAASRRRQLARIRAWLGTAAPADVEIAAALLQVERLCDAIAEGEFADLGLDQRAARAAAVQVLDCLLRS